ncbi:MAG TPA: ATP-binding protein, partial [Fibrella sp.]
DEIMQVVGVKIGQHMNLATCSFLDIDETQEKALTVSYFWGQPGVPTLLGQYRMRDFLTEEFELICRAGQTFVINDTQTDLRTDAAAYAPLSIGAFVDVPFHHQGQWTNTLAITDTQARTWRADELDLVRELATLVFPRLQRARTEESLRRLEKRTRIAIEAAELGTWEWNLITDEVYWNEQHYLLLGLQPPGTNEPQETLTSDNFIRHVYPDDLNLVKGELERAIRDKTVYEAEFRVVRLDGTIRWMSGYGRVTAENNEQATRLSGVMFDINDRKLADEALRVANQRKDEFLATLAHELRNPLAPIRNTLQILTLTSDGNEMTTSAVEMMGRQVDHLVRLVDDLLDVSRISRGVVQLRSERIDLRTIVERTVEAARPLYEAGGRELTVTLSAAPLDLQGDPTRLTQVVSNLLNNAAKFTNQGGKVWLSVEKEGQQALLRVRDNGLGIAAHQLERIFDLFAQADNTLERSQNGLGLGLTLVRQLVELHGGQVKASSGGAGQGSEFTVSLPLLADLPKPPPTADAAAKQPVTGRRILVIDDNQDAATTLGMLLKIKGHQTHTRFSGQEGITAAESLLPEVILLDIGMPGLNGYDTCRLIRSQPWGQTMILIALTGYGQESDKQLSQEAGFDAHL